MTSVPIAPAGLPWVTRVLDRTPIAPAWMGLGIAAGLMLCTLGVMLTTDPFASSGVEGSSEMIAAVIWMEVIQAIVAGYAAAAGVYVYRAAAGDLQTLRSLLVWSENEYDRARRELLTLRRSGAWLAAGLGTVLGLGTSLYAPGWIGGRPEFGDPLLTWSMFRSVVVFVLCAQTVFIDIGLASNLSRIGGWAVRVDLLDKRNVRPFATRGLRSVLLWIVPIVLASGLTAVSPTPDLPVAGATLLLIAATVALVIPTWGVHRALYVEKEQELERVRAEIRQERDRNLSDPDVPTPRLSNLLAYEGRITSVSAWPFDVPTLLRFSLYIALGLGSWLGGALVERFLDVWFW